ncbi:MAG: hypothetical protein GYA23_06525 [Methanomicrobiales archaeon]|nr:hypothetical protein [Methanomicrobiales archaeon]
MADAIKPGDWEKSTGNSSRRNVPAELQSCTGLSVGSDFKNGILLAALRTGYIFCREPGATVVVAAFLAFLSFRKVHIIASIFAIFYMLVCGRTGSKFLLRAIDEDVMHSGNKRTGNR